MATLRELGPQPFDLAQAKTLPVTAPAERWLVLVDDGRPASALAPGTTLSAGMRPPGIIVAAADLDQAVAFESAAFGEFYEVSALVLTEPASGRPGQPAIAGVVNGTALTRLMQRGLERGWSGTALPGTPSIPLVSRSCGFFEGGPCATLLSFPHRPAALPQCPNDRGLSAHSFVW
jgi:hypothetical protein